MSNPIRRLVLSALCSCLAVAAFLSTARAQLVKVGDFRIDKNSDTGLYVGGSGSPYDNAVQIDNRLWFTTQTGGPTGFGTVSYYDLTTKTINVFASLTAASGSSPQSSLTAVGNTLYFTTNVGGANGTGTIASVDITASTPVINTVYTFAAGTPAATNAANPRNPGGSITAIPHGDGSTDLYFTTPNGGTGAVGTSTGGALGTISRFNTATGYSTIYNFTIDPTSGRQPMEGFTNVGGKLYFTTMVGGANAASPGSNGAGTLSVFDPATGSVSIVASLSPGTVSTAPNYGSSQFAAHNVLQGSNGLLYFTTVGNATQPGSIQSFNLSTGVLSTVYALSPAVNSIFADGKFAYGSLTEYNGVLYFATMQGGLYNRGTIDAFDLASNKFIKLYDLDGGATDNKSYLGQGTRGGFTLVNENGVDYLYLLTNAGGANGLGTILRVTPIPEPGTMALLAVAGMGGWLWRRRAGAVVLPPSTTLPRVSSRDRRRAFTLIELLVVLAIISVLAGVAFPVFRSFIDRGKEVTCLSNLRQIGAAYLLYAGEHDGYCPSPEAIGNSTYRRSDDPLGLPILFGPYIGTENTADNKVRGLAKVWLCPGGRPTLKEFGNNYSWTIAKVITSRPLRNLENAYLNLLAYDNFASTLPSPNNVPEATSGPASPGTLYNFKPHRFHSQYNAVYADGHAAIK